MSPSKLLPKASFTLLPIEKSAQEKYDYGAVIVDLDLNEISGKYISQSILVE